jgi:tetratricopeptide (TPR) repeat protein
VSVKKPPRNPQPKFRSSGSKKESGTRVDLGDDLLEKPTVSTVLPTRSNSVSKTSDHPAHPDCYAPRINHIEPDTSELGPEQVADHLQSARILASEGILDDAKRLLRRILMADSSNVAARRMLEEIQDGELKQILAEGDGPRRRRPGRREPEPSSVDVSAELVLRDLDRDLNLGMFDDRELAGFAEQMDRRFAASSVIERVDIGIAFLEMGLFEVAIRQFQSAVARLDSEGGAPNERVSATSLLAYALISGGRAFDATLELQGLLADDDLSREMKIEPLYLMARAYEALGRLDVARALFKQVIEIDPKYRDAKDRAL